MTTTTRAATRIDAASLPEPDKLLPLRRVPDYLPDRGTKRIHVATVHRWVQRGTAGVRLRTVSVGAMRCTTLAWIAEWTAAVAAARERAAEPAPTRRPARRRATR